MRTVRESSVQCNPQNLIHFYAFLVQITSCQLLLFRIRYPPQGKQQEDTFWDGGRRELLCGHPPHGKRREDIFGDGGQRELLHRRGYNGEGGRFRRSRHRLRDDSVCGLDLQCPSRGLS